MASGITNIQLPADYTPVYNPQWFTATSSNYNKPNFTYTVIVTDLITGNVVTYNPPALPDFTLTFNAETFAEVYMKNYIPVNSYGWKVCVDAIRKIRVNIGETYSTPLITDPIIYYSGTNKDYIVWNGVRNFLEFQSYTYTDFVYDAGTSPLGTPYVKFLTDSLDEKTFSGRSNLFYALTSKVGDLATIRINTYDANGTPIGTSYIDNPQSASSTYSNKYLCIDLGHKGLSNISAAAVTGTFPIITSSVAYWDVYDVSVLNNAYYPTTTQTLIKRYTLECESKYDVITLHCLMKNGNYRTIHCSKNSERTSTNVKNTFKKLPYIKSVGGVVSYPYESAVEQTLNVSIQSRLKVNTDWLTEAECALYEEAVTSPSIYMDLGTGQGYASMKCTDGSYFTKKKYNEKMLSATFQLEYTHDNHRQRA